jgi:hypothetical protein
MGWQRTKIPVCARRILRRDIVVDDVDNGGHVTKEQQSRLVCPFLSIAFPNSIYLQILTDFFGLEN